MNNRIHAKAIGCEFRPPISFGINCPIKYLIVMKLVAFLIISLTFNAYADVLAQKIDLRVKNASFETVLRELGRKSGYSVIFKEKDLVGTASVTLNIRKKEVLEILPMLFAGQPLEYMISNRVINVTPKRSKPTLPSITRTVVQDTVFGVVTDSLGNPQLGASVLIKGTSVGTQTDQKGRFVFPNLASDAILVVSYTGFVEQEVPVVNRKNLVIVLKEDATNLEEVVVVGFGKQKRTDMVGSVVSVTPSDLKIPSSNLTTALAGRASGLIAFQRSGEPGQDNADFFIRGVTTFADSRPDPLILIDGVELTVTDLARLQPDDIGSFSIMKDATATAVYGARGANGVILVTTKEGVEGKAKVSLRMENSISKPTTNIELADPITYMRLHNEAVLTRDPLGQLPYSNEKIDQTIAGANAVFYPATDWRGALLKRYTMNQRVNLSVNGGGKVARYFVTASLNQDNGILKVERRNNFNNNIDMKNYNLRANVNVDLTTTTELTVRLNGNFDDYTGPVNGGEATYQRIMRANPVLFPAYYPVDEQHRYVQHIMFGNYEDGNYLNPYADMVKGYRDQSRALMLAQVELKQDLPFVTDGLSFRTMVNTNRTSRYSVSRQYEPFYYRVGFFDRRTNEYAIQAIDEDAGTEYLNYDPGAKEINSIFYLESALNYNRMFADRHSLSGMLIYIMRQSLNANEEDLQLSLPHRNTGLSGRFTYSYNNRYFAEFNFGYNGSERFHESKRFGFFPSFGLAWTVSNETFWTPIKPIVNNFRLRATYGLVGSDNIGRADDRFFYLSDVDMNNSSRGARFGRDYINSRNGIAINRYANPDITWEVDHQRNFALELGLFGSVQLQAEYFNRDRKNILMTRPAISQLGLAQQVRANVGEALSNGIDISLDYQHSYINGLWVSAMGNFTYATSSFKVYEEPLYINEPWRSRVGYSLAQQWGYIAEHLFVDEYEVANSPSQNFGIYGEGDIKFRDVNRDGQITQADQVPIGYPTTPEITYGMGFSAGYKNFDVSAFFQGLGRESFWIDPYATAPFIQYRYSDSELSGVQLQNQLLKAYADDHWSEDNRNQYALWPRLSTLPVSYTQGNSPNSNNGQRSTWFMQSGSFLRLKSAEIGYTIPQHVSQRVHIQQFRIYLNGTNLLTWSPFTMWDVEMAGNGLGYPIQRVFNVGVHINF